jgi:hypothetical protein
MRWLFCILFFLSAAAYSQPSDFIILKKKDKTVQSYYAGTQIEFVTTSGAYRNALINKIVHDSIFLQEFLIRTIPTTLGYYVVDTAGSFRYAYRYDEIGSIGPKEKKGFNVRGSGAALLGGGLVLTVASGVVYLADRQKFSPALLAASVGLAAVGYIMSRSGGKGIVIGKKNYHLEYINVTGDKK